MLRRFYRSDKIRNTPGVGLGLSLVSAIVKLHGFRLIIHPGPGGRVEIICPDEHVDPTWVDVLPDQGHPCRRPSCMASDAWRTQRCCSTFGPAMPLSRSL